MSVNQLCQRLAVCTLSSPGSLTNTIRSIQTSPALLKNFKYRIPDDVRIGRIRFPADFDITKHTIKPIPIAKTGGRGPDGRIWVHRIGGGLKQVFRMVDHKRKGPENGEPLVEKVYEVIKDDLRTANIALVASKDHKRWIVASENMKPGDLIKTSAEVTAMPVRANEGDSHPVASLPIGTLVHNIGGVSARAAGTSGVYLRRIGDKCIIRMPSKRELIVHETCMVTVGRVSNVDHNLTKKMTKAGENRWRGKRPKSGLWQRKTGKHGRKIRPIPAALDVTKPGSQTVWGKSFSFH